MTEKVLVRDSKAAPARRRDPDPSTGWKVAIAGGIAIAIVGWTDIVMAWYPPQFGSLEWEFGTISRTFDGLPLSTVGLLGLVAGLAARAHRRTLGVMAGVLIAITLTLGFLTVLYALDAAPAWAASAPPVRESLKIAFVRTPLFMITYLGLYSWMSWFTWRRWRQLTERDDT